MSRNFHRRGAKRAERTLLLLCVFCVSAVAIQFAHAQGPDQAEALAKLNEARRLNGVAPLAWNAQLEKVAQRHSDDMASKGFVDEVGSDGSSPRQRIEQSVYAKWPSMRVWGESIYAGQTTFDEALNFFLSDDAQRRVLVSVRVREVGIGITKDNLRTYWTVTLGAQPNLLPVFINDDAAVTKDRQVAVQLTQEDAVPNGEGIAIGRVLEVRISDKSDFSNAAWQPWEQLLPFTLSRGTGIKTIYIQMRDGAGRTTIATDSIVYDPNSRVEIRPFGPGNVPTLTPEPSLAPTLAPTPSTLRQAQDSGQAQVPSATPAATPAATPTTLTAQRPTPTAIVIGAPVVVDATALPTATPVPVEVALVPPSAAVVVFVEPTATDAARANAGMTTIVLTPLPETPAEALPSQSPAGLPDWVLPGYLIVQTAVIVVGFALFLRRK